MMKQMIMTLMAAVMVSTAAVAQDKNSNKPSEDNNRKLEMVKHRTDKMVEDYQLNDKQAKKLLELNTEYADMMRPPHHGHHGPHGMRGQRPEPPKDDMKGERPEPPKGDREDRREKMMETMKAYDAELQKIMTAEQYEKYKADMQQRHEKGHKGPHGPQ